MYLLIPLIPKTKLCASITNVNIRHPSMKRLFGEPSEPKLSTLPNPGAKSRDFRPRKNAVFTGCWIFAVTVGFARLYLEERLPGERASATFAHVMCDCTIYLNKSTSFASQQYSPSAPTTVWKIVVKTYFFVFWFVLLCSSTNPQRKKATPNLERGKSVTANFEEHEGRLRTSKSL